jgi:hypothetical protein
MNTTVKINYRTILKEGNQIGLVGFIHTVDNFTSQLAFFWSRPITLNTREDFFSQEKGLSQLLHLRYRYGTYLLLLTVAMILLAEEGAGAGVYRGWHRLEEEERHSLLQRRIR